MCVCVCVCATIVRIGHTLTNIEYVKITFVDFDIFRRLASFKKLHSGTLTYFFKVKIKNVNISETLEQKCVGVFFRFVTFAIE